MPEETVASAFPAEAGNDADESEQLHRNIQQPEGPGSTNGQSAAESLQPNQSERQPSISSPVDDSGIPTTAEAPAPTPAQDPPASAPLPGPASSSSSPGIPPVGATVLPRIHIAGRTVAPAVFPMGGTPSGTTANGAPIPRIHIRGRGPTSQHPAVRVSASSASGTMPENGESRPPINIMGVTQSGTAGRPNPRVTVDRSTGQMRLDVGGGNFVNLPLNRQEMSNGQLNVRVVQMDPLVPQPVHPHRQSNSTNTNNTTTSTEQQESSQRDEQTQATIDEDEEQFSKFKCEICCEFMKDPVGCSEQNCSSRFCCACLSRVARDAAPQKPKCPTCRVEFDRIVRDGELRQAIFEGPTRPCRFQGCEEKELKLPLIEDHEKQCPHVIMKCRYVTYGCTWTGKRRDVPTHESDECALHKVNHLIEELRRIKLDYGSRLDILNQQTGGSMHMMNVYRQNLQREQIKSTANLWDVLLFCHTITCARPFFMYTKDRWATFLRSDEARAAITNFLVTTPTMLLVAKTTMKGIQTCWHLLDEGAISSYTAEQFSIMVEDALICLCIGLLASLMITANFVDGESSKRWRRFTIPHAGQSPIMADVIAISCFTILLSILEYHQSGIKAYLIWFYLTVPTAFFPALVATLSHTAAGSMTTSPIPSAGKMSSLARAWHPFLFAIRFSLLASFKGIMPCLDAAIATSLLQPTQQKILGSTLSAYFTLSNCFFDNIPHSVFCGYLGARLGMMTVHVRDLSDVAATREAQGWVLDSLFSTCLLVIMNHFIVLLFAGGISMGKIISIQAQRDLAPDHMRKEFNLLGMICFGIWIAMLGVMLLA